MMKDQDGDANLMEMDDPVPMITRKHFEEALSAARKSVTSYDLDKFDQFRRKQDPAYAAKLTGSQTIKINWPDDNSSQF